MQIRHRIPSIFNLSMVDVLCCALGCVILLWLFYLREARAHQEVAEQEHLATPAWLEPSRSEREDAYALLTSLAGQVSGLEQDRTALRRQLADQRAATA